MDHKVDRSLFFKGDAVTHVKSLSHLNPAKVGETIRYCELSACFSWWWFGERKGKYTFRDCIANF